MKILVYFIPAIIAFFSVQASNNIACPGIMPENDLYIPPQLIQSMTEQDFNDALDRAENTFTNLVSEDGGKLVIKRLWSNGTVNASATRSGSNYIVNMYGGLARHSVITKDAFLMVACHEIGHHIGGAPKIAHFFNDWASNEGQSDYFAGLKCFRKAYTEQENRAWQLANQIHPTIEDKCTRAWGDGGDQAACMRLATAAMSLTELFRSVKFPNETLNIDTPDTSSVNRTFDGHPHPQCRLDTYFQGALCYMGLDEKLSPSDPHMGTCTRSKMHSLGLRPLCWYNPY